MRLPLLATLPLLAACGASVDVPPSIVFVSVDTLAARHMSLYGYERATTPGLERLASSSVVFDRCWANAPWTTLSYMSQFTGLYGEAFRRPETVEEDELGWTFAEDHTTLAELLRNAGYRTAAFVDNPNVGRHWRLDQGFELFDTSAAEIPLEDPTGGILHMIPRALRWLDEREGDAPFFLFLQVLDVHGPYLSAREHAGAFRGAPTSVADHRVPVATQHGKIFGAIPRHIAEPLVDEGEHELPVRPLVDAYDEGILAMDQALSSLLEELEARGILDQAVLVFSADHGESLVEHDSYFEHQLLHGEELHVPLLLRPPGGTTARRVTENVQLVDLYPTLAELVGATPPATHGRSLVPGLRGETLPSVPSVARAAFLDARSIVDGHWKLVETRPSPISAGVTGYLTAPRARAWLGTRFPELDGKVLGTHGLPLSALEDLGAPRLFESSRDALSGTFHALYDLRTDPGELRDVASEHPDVVERLVQSLRRAEARARAAYRPGHPGDGLEGGLRDRLRELGYTDG